MFYSHAFLVRKGPLSSVWLAAHMDMNEKIKKSQYHSDDIESTVGKSTIFSKFKCDHCFISVFMKKIC